ncbi:hypothetical protein L580_2777 [Serratia fonticola AU-P3(3)]|nr:hypothetical protein L580_2777 [Serratia fonticola AU-P3(3)]
MYSSGAVVAYWLRPPYSQQLGGQSFQYRYISVTECVTSL